MSPLLIFFILLNAYLLLLFVLLKTGWMQKLGMSLFGPALMIKTQRGRGLLDWFAKARGLFDWSAGFGLYLTGIIMFLMSLLLAVQLIFLFQIPVEASPSPRLILGIPGINPIIPVGFGIIALIFAVVVHEFSHGILARVHNLRVQTMGLLFFIVPIGAFVEPDEAELRAAPRKNRLKVFAAGPTSNLFFAVIFGMIFSMGIMSGASAIPGVPIQGVEAEGPAFQAGVQPGVIFTDLNGERLQNSSHFSMRMDEVRPGQELLISTHTGETYRVIAASCTETYGREYCLENGRPDPDNESVIGVRIVQPPPDAVQNALAHPFQDWRNTLYYVGLPFQALRGEFPMVPPYTQFYETPYDQGMFWFFANLTYWLFWINLMLGLTNALPIVPLDGGHMFRDFVGGLHQKMRPNASEERREQVVKRVSLTVTFILLGLIILQFFAAQIGALLF
ncbi:MAG TPA: site-2 protease family protein [Candidatus Thermoplasmatota archaeon]